MWDNVYLNQVLDMGTCEEGSPDMKLPADRIENIDSAAEQLKMTRHQLMAKIKLAGLNIAKRPIKHLTATEIERIRVAK